MLQQPLGDASQLYMDVERTQLASDRGAVGIAGPVQVLVAVAALQWLHSAHPEVVGIGTQDVNGLTEPEFDSESVTVEHEDLEWGKCGVGGKQEDGAAMGMAHDHEAHDTCRRAPDQIQGTVAQGHVVFAVDGAGRCNECGIILGKLLETNLFPIDSWPAPSTILGRGDRQVSHRVALGPGYELMPFGEQLSDELAAGVVGIGHEQNLAIQNAGDGEQQDRQLIEQGSGIAVGENQPFMNPRCEGYGGHMTGRSLDQQ